MERHDADLRPPLGVAIACSSCRCRRPRFTKKTNKQKYLRSYETVSRNGEDHARLSQICPLRHTINLPSADGGWREADVAEAHAPCADGGPTKRASSRAPSLTQQRVWGRALSKRFCPRCHGRPTKVSVAATRLSIVSKT